MTDEERYAQQQEAEARREAAEARRQAAELAIEQEKTRRAMLQAEQRAQQEEARLAAREQQELQRASQAEVRANEKAAEQARRKAEKEAEQIQRQRAATAAAAERQARSAKPVQVQISPPAHAIRAQTGTNFPLTPARWLEATGAVIGGTAVSAVFITAMPANTKWLAALLTGGLGLLLTTTSPIGTWAQEIGMGAAAASMAWLYFDLTGQIPAAQTSAAAARAKPVAVAVPRWRAA